MAEARELARSELQVKHHITRQDGKQPASSSRYHPRQVDRQPARNAEAEASRRPQHPVTTWISGRFPRLARPTEAEARNARRANLDPHPFTMRCPASASLAPRSACTKKRTPRTVSTRKLSRSCEWPTAFRWASASPCKVPRTRQPTHSAATCAPGEGGVGAATRPHPRRQAEQHRTSAGARA